MSILHRIAAFAALSLTAYLLIGDSAETCEHPATDAVYALSGDCGAPATLSLHTTLDACDLSAVTSTAAGLPSGGHFSGTSFEDGLWSLSGAVTLTTTIACAETSSIPNSSATRSCTAYRADDGSLRLSCTGSTSCLLGNRDVSCEAKLTPAP